MVIYTVKKGDSLYALAKQYGTTPTKILEDNGLADPDKLTVGQTLVIRIPTKTYTVQRGDTLEKIARKEGVSLRTLWQNNPILGGDTDIYTGQVLTVSYPPAQHGTLSVNAYTYPQENPAVLRRALPYLTYLTVLAARVTEEGDVIPPQDDDVLHEARNHGVAPVLAIENADESGRLSPRIARAVLTDPAARISMVDALDSLLKEKGYAGIDFSFAYIPEELSDAYANLIEDVRRRFCASGHCVFVSVAPKDADTVSGPLYQGQNYEDLGEAANSVRLMTYEINSAYGAPAPVAPFSAVEKVSRYASDEIPPSRLSIGIPAFGYDFALPYRAGTSRADMFSNYAAAMLAETKHAAIMYDDKEQVPYFSYYDTSTVPPVEHLVYFEDGKSVKAKLDLIDKLGLGGVGLWNLADDFPQFWLILHGMFDTVDAFPCHCR